MQLHAPLDIKKILVGNKCDLKDRKVNESEARLMASQYELEYFEVSAKENINVSDAFSFLIDLCFTDDEESLDSRQDERRQSKSVSVRLHTSNSVSGLESFELKPVKKDVAKRGYCKC